MAIQDGMRTHDEGNVKRYRMPDLLTLEEMKMYFAGTYGVGIELVDLSDEMREKATGVATLPVPAFVSPADSDKVLLRKQLGLYSEQDLKELEGRVLTRAEFEEKYGPQPAVETPAEKEARLNPPEDSEDENLDLTAEEGEAVGEGNSSDVDGPLSRVETEDQRRTREEGLSADKTEDQKQAELEQAPSKDPGEELSRLLREQNR